MRKLALAIFTAVVLLLSALAQDALGATYADTVTGNEIFATSTLGVFAGSASGPLPGSWSAAVEHSPLSSSAIITGGSFALATTFDGDRQTLTGSFSGGTVTQTGGFTGCVNQTYAVNGILVNVGAGLDGGGTGSFIATLTHYRFPLFGHCITYGARVVGIVTLAIE